MFRGYEEASKINNKSGDYNLISTPVDLYNELKTLWCIETCAPRLRDDWTKDNSSLGQCSISAFICQDIFGGQVYGMKTKSGGTHCYNVIDGIVFDLTSEQYGDKADSLIYDLDVDTVQNRESANHFAKEEKRERYICLKNKLKENLVLKKLIQG